MTSSVMATPNTPSVSASRRDLGIMVRLSQWERLALALLDEITRVANLVARAALGAHAGEIDELGVADDPVLASEKRPLVHST